jgi:hypothetical protein
MRIATTECIIVLNNDNMFVENIKKVTRINHEIIDQVYP